MNKIIDNTQNRFRTKLERLLEGSNVVFNGDNPWDIDVYNSDLYERILTQGSLGLGEAFMDGWWDSVQLDELFNKLCSAQIKSRVMLHPHALKNGLWAYFSNRQSKNRTSHIIKHHYDIGNELYHAMLDTRLTYSCGYWKNAKSLDEAQEHKFELICRKLNLQPGQRVLDIGCGWGSFMKYAVEKYEVSCVGVTLSNEQLALCKSLCADLPIEIRFADYRELNETFDHIVSIGMFEHVGYKNYRQYMQVVRRCLKDDGLFLLHTIGGNKSVITVDPWIDKYIFPGGVLPSIKQISKAIEGKFVVEDWHSFGADYDKTLMCWFENVSKNWESLADNYDDRFFRMWKYYLLSCAGAFRARGNQLWQIVLSKNGVQGGYVSVR
ncbi:cyclopropane fatty acyl phospholipid synthase [Methylobacter sp.]|uniref:cyclopropane fatty acyl phospholipid synthase n=1 Tax=Methylobacter sp. TaxID=2051955 RepID=UPI001205BEE8|nr:cyclopropane fatty acyl phospholipid synthase [Methylobacter sp.]TAK65141.1 MAG: cyclopropane fatty acyl phospholipid synthase [Methylobacter sp.]